MSRSLSLVRHQAVVSQSYRCIYCTSPVWEGSPERFISTYAITRSQAELLRCTAEHLLPKSSGGKNAESNIVAACWFCNHTRHKARVPLEPDAYGRRVRSRVAKGGWLPNGLSRRLRSGSPA
jgi:5-methylcytosine-specific restriction endonuclease McrA